MSHLSCKNMSHLSCKVTLESQLLERQKDIEKQDEQLKLLTDSQHNRQDWWTCFCSWFISPSVWFGEMNCRLFGGLFGNSWQIVWHFAAQWAFRTPSLLNKSQYELPNNVPSHTHGKWTRVLVSLFMRQIRCRKINYAARMMWLTFWIHWKVLGVPITWLGQKTPWSQYATRYCTVYSESHHTVFRIFETKVVVVSNVIRIKVTYVEPFFEKRVLRWWWTK